MAIEQRGKNVWRITVYTSKVNGVYQRVTETFHGLKSEAKLRENELKKQVKSGGFVVNKKMTFSELSEIWLEKHAKNLAPKTYNEDKRLLKVVNTYIGDISLSNITPITLTTLYNKLRERGKMTREEKFISLTEKTIANYYSVINRIFNKAIKWEFLERNPNEKVTKPKVVKYKAQYYDEEQAKKLLECLKNENLKYQAIIYLAIDLGARSGEITGLEWEDIDFNKRSVNINKVTQYVNREIIEKFPKNNSSIRQNFITHKTVEILKKYQKEQLEKEML